MLTVATVMVHYVLVVIVEVVNVGGVTLGANA